MKQEFTELIESFGWVPIVSKNPYMVSFRHDENKKRMNFYFSTGTITVQNKYGFCSTYRGIKEISQLEDLLIEVKDK